MQVCFTDALGLTCHRFILVRPFFQQPDIAMSLAPFGFFGTMIYLSLGALSML
jgi:hypothetical protein